MLVGNEAEEADVLAEPRGLHRSAQRTVAADVVANQEQLEILVPALLADPGKGADQALEVLVRLDVSGEEDEPPVQLVALADPGLLLLPRVHQELGVDGVGNHVHLVGLGPGIEAQDVRPGRLGHGEDHRGVADRAPHHVAGVAPRHAIGQVLGEEKVNAVVDGDHRRDGAQKGTHVVRRMEQLGSQAPELEGDREVLAHAIARRLIDHRDEVVGQVAQGRLVGLVAEEEVGRVLIDLCELTHQVSDVGADPEIPPFSYVDRDLQPPPR